MASDFNFGKYSFLNRLGTKRPVCSVNCTFSYPCEDKQYCSGIKLTMNPGKYLFEVYGAQGSQNKGYGGKGGYAKSEVIIKSITDIFLFIGSQGTWVSSGNSQNSFNGGGRGYNCGPGGGATDFRLSANDLGSRFLIGGGGGAECSWNINTFRGGSGGGIYGRDGHAGAIKGTANGMGGNPYSGGSGSQNGIFGFGANITTQNYAGGSGGGLFGGGVGQQGGSSGAGGSGFAYSKYKPLQIREISEIQILNDDLLEGVKSGDGYAVIGPYLSKPKNVCSCYRINANFYFLFKILSSHQIMFFKMN